MLNNSANRHLIILVVVIGSELHPYRNFHTYGLRLHWACAQLAWCNFLGSSTGIYDFPLLANVDGITSGCAVCCSSERPWMAIFILTEPMPQGHKLHITQSIHVGLNNVMKILLHLNSSGNQNWDAFHHLSPYLYNLLINPAGWTKEGCQQWAQAAPETHPKSHQNP